MKNKRLKSGGGLIRNAYSSWISIFAAQGIALVLTPFLIGKLGADAYGIWLIAINLTGLFAFLDMGLAPAVVSNVAAHLAKGDTPSARSYSSTALCVYLAVALLVVVAFAGFGHWVEYLFVIPPGSEKTAGELVFMLGVVIAAGFPVRAFEGLLYAVERIDIVNYLDTGRSLVRLAVVVWVVLRTGSLEGLGWAHSAVWMLSYGVTIWLAARHAPREIMPSLRMDRRTFRSLITFGRDSIAITIANRVVMQGPVLLTGNMGTVRQVTDFGIASRLINNDMIMVQSASGVAQPRFAALGSTGRQDEVHKILVRATLWAALAACLVGLGLWFLCGEFIRLWVGEGFETAALVVRIMVAPVTISLMLHPCLVLLLGIKRHRAAGVMGLGESVLIVGLAFWLIPLHGAAGAAAATGAGMLALRLWWLPYYACRQCGMPLRRLLRKALLPPLAASAVCALVCWALFGAWEVRGWVQFCGAGAALCAVFGACAWLLALDGPERAMVRGKLAARLGRGLGS